jgi:ribose-phosphate pyrophosphokinase
MIGADFAIMHKTRPAHEVAEVTEITGKVDGKIAIVGDDVITTGGTVDVGATALREAGARDVWWFVTHGLFAFSELAMERMAAASLSGIVTTDSVPIDPLRRPENMTVLSVSGLLAETILNVFADESVSAIFGGENQLF